MVDLAIEHGDFPWQTVSLLVYQRLIFFGGGGCINGAYPTWIVYFMENPRHIHDVGIAPWPWKPVIEIHRNHGPWSVAVARLQAHGSAVVMQAGLSL